MEFVEANVVKDPSSENATIVCQDCTYPNEIVLKILGRIIFQKPDRQNYKTESEYEEAVRTAYSCPRCEREFEMSEEKKEKPEAEITELTDELRRELGQYSNERPHPAPKILTKDAKPVQDALGVTREGMIAGKVPAEVAERVQQETMMGEWWMSLSPADREKILPSLNYAVATAWIDALRPYHGEYMKHRDRSKDKRLPPRVPGSEKIQ